MTKVSTPDLFDDHEDKLKILAPVFNNYGGKDNFFGQIVTVKCFEDNSVVKELVSTPGEGRVMVVDGGGSLRRALLGDMLAEKAAKNGWAGFVIYGCIRDCDEIAQMPIGVKAMNTTPAKTDKKGIGDLNVPVQFAGHTISPDEWLYADNNGVVVCADKLI